MGKGNYRASDEGLGVGVECLTIHYDGEVWELSSFAFYKYEQCYYKKLMMAEDETLCQFYCRLSVAQKPTQTQDVKKGDEGEKCPEIGWGATAH